MSETPRSSKKRTSSRHFPKTSDGQITQVLRAFVEQNLQKRLGDNTGEFVSHTRINIPQGSDAVLRAKMSPTDVDCLNYLRRVFQWWPANPNKPESLSRVLATYHVSKLQTGIVKMSNAANSVVGLKSIPIDALQSEIAREYQHYFNGGIGPKFILDDWLERDGSYFVAGSRGSGKTAFLNYWLILRHPQFESTNTTWFRFDVAKVYEAWQLIQSMPSV